jgi:hypothetical protein
MKPAGSHLLTASTLNICGFNAQKIEKAADAAAE